MELIQIQIFDEMIKCRCLDHEDSLNDLLIIKMMWVTSQWPNWMLVGEFGARELSSPSSSTTTLSWMWWQLWRWQLDFRRTVDTLGLLRSTKYNLQSPKTWLESPTLTRSSKQSCRGCSSHANSGSMTCLWNSWSNFILFFFFFYTAVIESVPWFGSATKTDRDTPGNGRVRVLQKRLLVLTWPDYTSSQETCKEKKNHRQHPLAPDKLFHLLTSGRRYRIQYTEPNTLLAATFRNCELSHCGINLEN